MKYREGYIALLTVLILGAVMVLFLTGGLFRAAGVSKMRIQEEASARAQVAATACAEQALYSLLNSTSYVGGELLPVSDDTCYVRTIGGTGNTNRTVQTTSTVLGVTRKIQVNVATVQPTLSISAWRDVTSFSTSTGGGPIVYDWTNPSVSSTIDLPGTANALSAAAVGTMGYIGRKSSTDPEFYIIDASDAANPSIVGSLDLPGNVNGIAISGDYAYVVTKSNTNELIVVDMTTPSSPVIATSFDLAGTGDGRDVAVKGNRLYVTRNNFGSNPTFHIFDISTPSAPTSLGSANISGEFDVALSQSGTDYAFIASESNQQEFQSVDVTTPGSLSVNGSLDLSGKANAYAAAVSGTVAFVGTANRGGAQEFYAVDVSTPASPTILSSADYQRINVLRAGYGFVFAGMDDAANEFVVLDLSNPASVVQAATLNLVTAVDGLGVSASRAFAATASNSQEVIIITPAAL